jgi:subtilisin family serine protease
MRWWVFLALGIVVSSASRCAAGERTGFLLGSVSDLSSNGPKEGDIQLKDAQGRWYIVQGIPVDPPLPTKQSVTVGVIDSGVLADHPQLKGLIAEQQDFTGEGNADRIGHGTVVTILVRAPAGQAPTGTPSPRFLEAKVANADGSIDKNAVILAIQWAVQHGAKIVNLSLGFREGTDDYSGVCDIIRRSPDALFVAAAGNFGPTVKVYPAACVAENLISVAATRKDGKMATYSGRGDIAAPGDAILVPQKQ